MLVLFWRVETTLHNGLTLLHTAKRRTAVTQPPCLTAALERLFFLFLTWITVMFNTLNADEANVALKKCPEHFLGGLYTWQVAEGQRIRELASQAGVFPCQVS